MITDHAMSSCNRSGMKGGGKSEEKEFSQSVDESDPVVSFSQ